MPAEVSAKADAVIDASSGADEGGPKDEYYNMKLVAGATIGVVVVVSLGYYFFSRERK